MAELSKKRPTLALVCASIHTGASRGLWNGFVDEALRRGSNVLCLPGGRLGAAEEFESQRNAIFELASSLNAEGIASWTTSLSGSVPLGEIEAFIGRFEGLPVVSLSQPVRGAPLVAFDGYRGMRALVEHLIDEHGYEKIAFIRGPESHVSAEHRFKAYRDVLAERGIPFRPELVTEPLPWGAGLEAATSFLDIRKLLPGRDFRALVAASDLLAFWAMHEFLRRGFRVPEDLAVGGFNDSLESALSSPALSTVAVDFTREGEVAADLLLRRLEGQTPSPETILPAVLRLRRSCGCPMTLLEDRQPAAVNVGLPAAGPGRRAFVAELAGLLGAGKSRDWIESLIDGLKVEIGKPGSGAFLAALEPALDRSSPEGLDPEGWQAALGLLRRRALAEAVVGGAEAKPSSAIEELFHRASALAAETSRRAEIFKHWREGQRTEALRRVGAGLLMSHDLDAIAARLAEDLPGLGIPSAYLVLDSGKGEKARLVAAAERGKSRLAPGGELPFDPALLLPREVLPSDRNYAFVVEPLFFRELRIGRLILEIGPRDGNVYEELRAYVSSALRGAFLFSQAESARLRAEKADMIKTRLLANLSRELCEPLERIIALAGGPEAGPATIRSEAGRQLGLIEELLDLSRADSGELELSLGPVDLGSLIGNLCPASLPAPPRLPLIKGDEKRLEHILASLAGAAGSGAEGAAVSIDARLELPWLVVEIVSPGPGEGRADEGEVSGLGLALSRRILALHGAFLEDGPEGGFRLSIPLPTLSGSTESAATSPSAPILGLASSPGAREAIEDLLVEAGIPSGSRKLASLSSLEDWEEGLAEAPAAMVWNLEDAPPAEWEAMRRFRFNPLIARLPLLVYPSLKGRREGQVPRGRLEEDFLSLLESSFAVTMKRPVLVLSENEACRARLLDYLARLLPDCPRRSFPGTEAALASLSRIQPSFVAGDLAAVRAWLSLRASPSRDPGMLGLPVLAFVSEPAEAWKPLVEEAGLFILPGDSLPPPALRSVFELCASGGSRLPAHTGAMVRRAESYMAANFGKPVARAELAEAVGANEDYLSRVFRQELGVSPWEFLGRYRVYRAKLLLESGDESLAAIASAVGLSDQAYFSRVFKKFTGFTPLEYRDGRRP